MFFPLKPYLKFFVQVEKDIIDLNMNSKLVKIVGRRRIPAKKPPKTILFSFKC
jgi:hypothetical protein